MKDYISVKHTELELKQLNLYVKTTQTHTRSELPVDMPNKSCQYIVYNNKQMVEAQMCGYRTCAVHMQTHFARRNFSQPDLSVSTVTVPSWRRGFLS